MHTLKKKKKKLNFLNHLLEAVRGIMSDGKPSCLRLQTQVPVSLGPSQRRRTRPGGAGVPHAPSSAPPSGPEPRARHSQRERPPTLCQFWSQAGRKKKGEEKVTLGFLAGFKTVCHWKWQLGRCSERVCLTCHIKYFDKQFHGL